MRCDVMSRKSEELRMMNQSDEKVHFARSGRSCVMRVDQCHLLDVFVHRGKHLALGEMAWLRCGGY